jgi:hypothetical protein
MVDKKIDIESMQVMNKNHLKKRYPGYALITGASGGLGEEFAEQLAKEGVDLVLVARRKEELEKISKRLTEKYKIKTKIISQDVSELDSAKKIKSELEKDSIQVSMLINNAGYGTYGNFIELDFDKELKMIDLNCRAPIALTRLFAPEMVKRKNGAIIFLSSIGAYQPTPFWATYGATKAFNLMIGEALWAELKPHHVDVISLSPGFTKTQFQANASNTKTPEPLTGWSEPKDVVSECLSNLGKDLSVVPGFMNFLATWSMRFTPRKLAAIISHKLSQKISH